MSGAIAFARGSISLLLLVVNTVFWSTPFLVVVVAKLLVPIQSWRYRCAAVLVWLASMWIVSNNLGLDLLQRIDWDIDGVEGLPRDATYLVGSNHQSWIDIVVLQRTFMWRIPFLRFFIKQQLIWLPILGLVWWALEMPFMKRYSKEKLEKHPELRGKDLEATRRSCERMLHTDVTMLNFLEGTRFSPSKHAAQSSPYRNLLRPKAGGVAFVLNAMGNSLTELLDVTIVYPEGQPTLWDLVSGRVSRIVVRVDRHAIPDDLRRGDYADDAAYRDRFQEWIRDLWVAKDARIDTLRERSA